MYRVMLTDGQQRKTLAATRSLGRQGHQVLVADSTRFSTSRFSRWCRRGLVSPDPADARTYGDWLLETTRRLNVDVLLPMDDDTTALAVALREQLPCRTLVPTPKQFGTGRDKLRTAALAAETGVPHPLTRAAANAVEAQAALTEIGGPAVIRSRFASGGRDLHFVGSPEEIRPLFTGAPAPERYFIQKQISWRRKFDVCLLFDREGDLRASFVQEELRWFPLEYGASTVQESVHRPDLVRLAVRLLAPIGWRGPVEVEFVEDALGRPVLMEINPRFWASLALAIRCGVDFPGICVRLAAGEDARGPEDYPAGIRCRWLLPGDLLRYLADPRRREMQPSPFSWLDENTFDDIVSWEDPGPLLGFTLAVLRHAWSRRMWRTLLRW